MKPEKLLSRRSTYRFIALTSVVAIFGISSIPNLPQPEIEYPGVWEIRLDYLFHFLVFFVPGFSVVLWLSDSSARMSKSRYGLILLVGIAFGLADELHQLYVPGRRFNPVDFILNAAGFTAGTLFARYWFIPKILFNKPFFRSIKKQLFPTA